ncbi:hypothetical protein E1B28_009449 [Marasmius oreades]|uniref:Uncharacterized protein n=1 Tax=Marasmius oreades TaxID=181124 RepID=A0A9P7RVA6_9AGAR|nr:uncharacterized protein E1B28_009449 [Marasmius oreades]KAG7090330.1 hypothetical protein E1B28_009449 [Marasmius oreades]
MFEHHLAKYKEIKRNRSAVENWNREKEQHLKLATSHASQCRIWDSNNRGTEQKRLRNERRQEAIKRLSASGWGPEELRHMEFYYHRLFELSKPITERTWNNLEPQLVRVLRRLKYRRLEKERCYSLKSRYKLLKIAYENKKYGNRLTIYPPLSDLILDGILGSIDDTIWNTPLEQKLTISVFIDALHDAAAEIAEFSLKWIKQNSLDLTKLLRRSGLDGDYDLRTTIFSCKYCGEKTWVPRIFMHDCYYL